MFLNQAESDAINQQVARVESRTGVQVVTAVIGKADTYPEVPWKAFALGAAIAAAAVVASDAWRPEWTVAQTATRHAVTILAVGAALALLAIEVPAVGRWFLTGARRELEVRHHAQLMFHEHGVAATRRRTGVLVLVSRFERRIEIVADIGFRDRVTQADWDAVIERMTPMLADARVAHALQEGLTAIEAVLTAKGFRADAGAANELPDRPVEERGV